MSFLLRLFGMLGLVGTLGAATIQGGQLVTRSIDVVKKMLTLFELSTLRDRLLSEFEFSGSVPRPGDDEALGNFIREEVRSRSGTRDPAYDLWGNAYRFDAWSGDDQYVLFSTGPDGQAGDCADVRPDAIQDVAEDEPQPAADDVCTWLETPKRQSPFAPIR